MREFGKGTRLVQLIPRKQFDELCQRWNLDKGVRRFSTWEQTCTHVMAYLLRLESLREIESALFVPKSTFSDANRSRCSGFFQDLCGLVLRQIQRQSPNRKVKRALKYLLAVDSSECRVHGSLSVLPLWHQRKVPRDKRKASLKIHAVWNVGNQWVDDFMITPNRITDVKASLRLSIKPGHMYVFDKGYFDIRFWWKIFQSGAHFVTRLKDSPARSKVRQQVLQQSEGKDGLLWEGTCGRSQSNMLRLPKQARAIRFRHIIYRDPGTKKVFDFVTSDFNTSGAEVAELYKKRWAVELLFRWLKGHLNIRYFASKNINAIEIQVAMAVLVQLLVRLYRGKTRQSASLWQCLRMMRIDLIHQGLRGSTPQRTNDSKYWTAATAIKRKKAG